jgi:hypothetical protein
MCFADLDKLQTSIDDIREGRHQGPARACDDAKDDMKEAANCGGRTPATSIRSFCLNGDLLGAIA